MVKDDQEICESKVEVSKRTRIFGKASNWFHAKSREIFRSEIEDNRVIAINSTGMMELKEHKNVSK
jgi:hypothetical protein